MEKILKITIRRTRKNLNQGEEENEAEDITQEEVDFQIRKQKKRKKQLKRIKFRTMLGYMQRKTWWEVVRLLRRFEGCIR